MANDLMDAGEEIKAKFSAHTCTSDDVNQVAARIVRERQE
jgi:hypothetical protein